MCTPFESAHQFTLVLFLIVTTIHAQNHSFVLVDVWLIIVSRVDDVKVNPSQVQGTRLSQYPLELGCLYAVNQSEFTHTHTHTHMHAHAHTHSC